MRNLSIRLKITLWFSVILVAVVSLAFAAVLSVGASVLMETVKNDLVETIEDNVDEVEYHEDSQNIHKDNDADVYITYNNGYLEVDDDYLDLVNGISTALYTEDGQLLYGENPIAAASSSYEFQESTIQKVTVNGTTYYIYDRQLEDDELEGLWLRGVVSEEEGQSQLTSITKFSLLILPILVAFAVIGGYLIAKRTLRPIKEIEEAAEEISEGDDLKKRIELAPGNDELHQLADTFNGMVDRLDKAFESEKQFTSDVSHELRTPMSVILAQCEYSLEDERTAEEYKAALEMIQRQGSKMNRLIEDMLRYRRIERKADSYVVEDTDYSALVTSVCEDMALLKENGITLITDIHSNIHIQGSRELLVRMLSNLIANAYRYGKDNGTIEVSLYRKEDEAVLKVKDDGIGIAESEQEKIFNRFYRVDHARHEGGTGLGLSMAKEIAQFHNGTIKVESALHKGSTFTVTIPSE